MSFESTLEKYHFDEIKEFSANIIRIDKAVRDMCARNSCGQYGKNYMCPPLIQDISEWKKEISFFECSVMVTKIYPRKSSFDLKAMIEGMTDFNNRLHKVKESLSEKTGGKKVLVLGAGSCSLCKKCASIENEPCRFPEKAFPSVEACGIDVIRLCKEIGVKYNNGQNTLTYIGLIFRE